MLHASRSQTIGRRLASLTCQSPERKRRVARRPSTSPARQVFSIVALLAFATPASAGGGVDPLSGIDFVRITHPGNAPWMGDGTEGDRAVGRGSVDYEYSIGRFEITTSQWVEFFNAAYDRPAADRLPHLIPPTFWGATPTSPNTPGGLRWSVPAGNDMRPVGNISWRMAAMYCNWLHNNKSTDRQAFLDGAYAVSTFGYTGTVFTDQWAHHPDARYWIPTWDEQLKAGHYDPALNNGEGGWWRYNISSDTVPVYGPPGVMVNGQMAQANAGWQAGDFPGHNPFTVPLGAYPDVESPWGLFDTSGGTAEWTEEIGLVSGVFPVFRGFDGSAWTVPGLDQVHFRGGDSPSFSFYDLGFRVASSVPAPGTSALLAGLLLHFSRRRSA